MARPDDKSTRGRGRKVPSPAWRSAFYAVVKPGVLLRRGHGRPASRITRAAKRAVYASGAMLSMLVLGLFRRELMALAFMFGAVLLDTDQHSTPAAETYTNTQAASFYSNANGAGSNGTIRFTFQPTLASTTYVGGNFHALFADNSQHGGIWLNDAKIEMYTAPGDALVFSQAMTWSALQTMTITIVSTGSKSITIAGATTGNGTFSFSTAPNYFDNTQSLGVGSLPGSSAFRFAGVIGDVDDGSTALAGTGSIALAADTISSAAAATVVGTASIALAADTVASTAAAAVAGSGAITFADDTTAGAGVGSVAGSAAIALADDTLIAAGDAGANGGNIQLADDTFAGTATANVVGAGAVALAPDTVASTAAASVVGAGAIQLADDTTTGVGTVPLAGTGAIALANDTVAGAGTVPTGFGPGVGSSAIATFGHSAATMSAPGGYIPPGGGPGGPGTDTDGRTPTAVNTQVANSTFYAAVGRPVAIAGSKNLTDNKGNNALWTEIRRDNYGTFDPTFAPWEAAVFVCLNGAGGTNHIVTTPGVAGDELGLGWDEIQRGFHMVATSFAARLTGQVQNSAPLSTNGPGWVYVDWFGARNTFGAEGFVWTVNAIGQGTNVGDWQVCDSRIVNHTDGWFQWKRWRRYFPAKTLNIQLAINEATLNPAQPAFFYAAAFQEEQFIDGDAAIVLANDTVAGQGVVVASGAGAIALAPDTVVGAGAAAVTGAGLQTSAADQSTVVATAAAAVVGLSAIQLADDTTTGSGDVADGPVGSAAITFADDTVAGDGSASVVGAGGFASAPDTVVGVGASAIAGAGLITEADDVVIAAGEATVTGAGAIQLADDVLVGAGFAVDAGTVVGTAAITFDDDTTSAAATEDTSGAGAIVFNDDLVVGFGSVVALLPPLPIEVTITRPPPPRREPTKLPNPRPITPNIDASLHRNLRPECSLVESMADLVDDMRQMEVDLGLRFYEVWSVVVAWSGGERHRGAATVIGETPFLPIPVVNGIGNVNRELRPGGSVKRGDIWLRKLSPRYTQDDILLLFPRELRANEEHFIEVRGDARDGKTVRDRYIIVGRPERKAFEWEVRLTKQDENRTRDGVPR